MEKIFKVRVKEERVHGFHTSFSLVINDETIGLNPECLIHRIAYEAGIPLGEREGMVCTITMKA